MYDDYRVDLIECVKNVAQQVFKTIYLTVSFVSYLAFFTLTSNFIAGFLTCPNIRGIKTIAVKI